MPAKWRFIDPSQRLTSLAIMRAACCAPTSIEKIDVYLSAYVDF
jgi:hypothetical protein